MGWDVWGARGRGVVRGTGQVGDNKHTNTHTKHTKAHTSTPNTRTSSTKCGLTAVTPSHGAHSPAPRDPNKFTAEGRAGARGRVGWCGLGVYVSPGCWGWSVCGCVCLLIDGGMGWESRAERV